MLLCTHKLPSASSTATSGSSALSLVNTNSRFRDQWNGGNMHWTYQNQLIILNHHYWLPTVIIWIYHLEFYVNYEQFLGSFVVTHPEKVEPTRYVSHYTLCKPHSSWTHGLVCRFCSVPRTVSIVPMCFFDPVGLWDTHWYTRWVTICTQEKL